MYAGDECLYPAMGVARRDAAALLVREPCVYACICVYVYVYIFVCDMRMYMLMCVCRR